LARQARSGCALPMPQGEMPCHCCRQACQKKEGLHPRSVHVGNRDRVIRRLRQRAMNRNAVRTRQRVTAREAGVRVVGWEGGAGHGQRRAETPPLPARKCSAAGRMKEINSWCRAHWRGKNHEGSGTRCVAPPRLAPRAVAEGRRRHIVCPVSAYRYSRAEQVAARRVGLNRRRRYGAAAVPFLRVVYRSGTRVRSMCVALPYSRATTVARRRRSTQGRYSGRRYSR